MNLATHKNPRHNQTCKHIQLGMDVCTLKQPHAHYHAFTQVHTQKNKIKNAHIHNQTHIHVLCPGCVVVGAELSISSPALTAYPGPRR